MSRSYKKSLIAKDPANKLMKKYSNRIIRNINEDYCPQGGQYKKYFEPWNISDYREYLSRNDFETVKEYKKFITK